MKITKHQTGYTHKGIAYSITYELSFNKSNEAFRIEVTSVQPKLDNDDLLEEIAEYIVRNHKFQ